MEVFLCGGIRTIFYGDSGSLGSDLERNSS